MEAAALVSRKQDISLLFPEQTSSSKDKEIRSQFSHVRIIQGDGNCLYRSLFFALLESMIHNDEALEEFRIKVVETCADLDIAGFDQRVTMPHLDRVVCLVEQCQEQCPEKREEELLHLFNQQMMSDSAVQYLRLLASAHLQINADFFSNFVEAPNIRLYCQQEVEAMAMEGDHVEILAVTQALDISIHIVSLEGQDLAHHVIPETSEPSMHLLHQSSHYNIIYPLPQS